MLLNVKKNRLSKFDSSPDLEPRVMLMSGTSSVVNEGVLDDRSTISNYKESGDFGQYKIQSGKTTDPKNASRIERRLPRVNEAKGRRANFGGTFQLENDIDNVYFAQVHGNSDKRGESPAIKGPVWLLRADKTFSNGKATGKADIFLEENDVPGGRRSNNTRSNEKLGTVDLNKDFDLDIITGYDKEKKTNAFTSIDIKQGSNEFGFNGRHNYKTDNLVLRYGAYGAPKGGNGTVSVKNATQSIRTA